MLADALLPFLLLLLLLLRLHFLKAAISLFSYELIIYVDHPSRHPEVV